MNTSLMNNVKHIVGRQIIASSFQLFIEPLTLVAVDNNDIYVKTYNDWSKAIVTTRFGNILKKAFETQLNKQINLHIICDS